MIQGAGTRADLSRSLQYPAQQGSENVGGMDLSIYSQGFTQKLSRARCCARHWAHRGEQGRQGHPALRPASMEWVSKAS